MLNGTYEYVIGLDGTITLICQQAIQVLLQQGYDVIVDCCNNDQQRRWGWLGAAVFDRSVGKFAVVFPMKDKEWHIANALKSSKELSPEAWGRIYDLHVAQYQPLQCDDYDEIWYVDENLEIRNRERGIK